MKLLDRLPSLKGKEKDEIVDLLLHEEYGYFPNIDISVDVTLESKNERFCAGKAVLENLVFHCKSALGEHTFPAAFIYPKTQKPSPAFVYFSFRYEHQPTEEIIDNGYAILSILYKDVSSDDGDFTNGIAGLLYKDGERGDTDCGKLGIWAWAASRLLDYALTRDVLDHSRISVIGHSRLGKTALLAGMLDERFLCAFSNDSGCSGAALARETGGETVEAISRVFPFWFCKNYYKYANNEETMPFDQHFLLAANYPHLVYVASALEDEWAYPQNEYLSCVAASEFYTARGRKGFISDDELPELRKRYNDGDIGYHLRPGRHYLSREDWQRYFEFLSTK